MFTTNVFMNFKKYNSHKQTTKKLPFSKFLFTHQIPHFGLFKALLPESYFLNETIYRKTQTSIIFVPYFPANDINN